MNDVYVPAIGRAAKFERRSGSYYDYVAEIAVGSEVEYLRVCAFFRGRGWQVIFPENTLLVIFLQDRRIVKCWRVY